MRGERGRIEIKRMREGEDQIESKEVPRRVDVRAWLIKSNLIKIPVLIL
jgi:hypothetical protein